MEKVIAMERGEQEQRIKEALELEEFRFAKLHREALRAAEDERARLRSDLATRGIFHSSVHTGGVIESYVKMLERLVDARIELRKELVHRVPDLASPAYLAELKEVIDRFVEAQWASVGSIIAQSYRGGESEDHFRQLANTGQWEDTPVKLKSVAQHEIEILKREAGLGMLEPKRPGVVVNISDSNVANLNLGNIVGNIQAFVVSLEDAGNRELAAGLKELIERVAEAEELGAARTELIESVATIGEQAALPRDRQRRGLVKTLMNSLGPALMHAAHLAQIWSTVGPLIARYFRLPWP